MVACFIGHRKVNATHELKKMLYKTIKNLIELGIDTFLFGSNSEFNTLCWQCVTELKQTFTIIKRIYIRASFPTIDKTYYEYLLENYEDSYFPEKVKNCGKNSYVIRNEVLIDESDICVFYYDESYSPAPSMPHKSFLFKNKNSGTAIAYKYAKGKKKHIINLFVK